MNVIKRISIFVGLALLLPTLIFLGVRNIVDHPDENPPFNRSNEPGFFELSAAEQEAIKAEDDLNFDRYIAQSKIYERTLFYSAVILGFVSIVLGAFIKIPEIGAAFLLGGVASCVTGFVKVIPWYTYVDEGVAHGLLLLGFFLLLFVGTKVYRDQKPNK
jgi:hypothetical protein